MKVDKRLMKKKPPLEDRVRRDAFRHRVAHLKETARFAGLGDDFVKNNILYNPEDSLKDIALISLVRIQDDPLPCAVMALGIGGIALGHSMSNTPAIMASFAGTIVGGIYGILGYRGSSRNEGFPYLDIGRRIASDNQEVIFGRSRYDPKKKSIDSL